MAGLSRGRSIRAMTTLALISFSAACATVGPYAAPSDDVSNPPRAQPGDRVVIEIWNEPEMSDTFAINQDGNVALPRLGIRQVGQQPIEEIESSLRTDFSEFLRNPSVQVAVLRRISVLGEVRQPGVYLADLTMGVRELIAMAGGATDPGGIGRVTIIRNGAPIDLNGRDEVFLATLRSGDQVIVRQRNLLLRNPLTAASTLFTAITLLRQFGLF